MGIVREQYSKCHSRHFFIYARVSSSEWELFGHIARSAFRRTPSGREMVAKPAGNLWQADFHPTPTCEHQSGNEVVSEDTVSQITFSSPVLGGAS